MNIWLSKISCFWKMAMCSSHNLKIILRKLLNSMCKWPSYGQGTRKNSNRTTLFKISMPTVIFSFHLKTIISSDICVRMEFIWHSHFAFLKLWSTDSMNIVLWFLATINLIWCTNRHAAVFDLNCVPVEDFMQRMALREFFAEDL